MVIIIVVVVVVRGKWCYLNGAVDSLLFSFLFRMSVFSSFLLLFFFPFCLLWGYKRRVRHSTVGLLFFWNGTREMKKSKTKKKGKKGKPTDIVSVQCRLCSVWSPGPNVSRQAGRQAGMSFISDDPPPLWPHPRPSISSWSYSTYRIVW